MIKAIIASLLVFSGSMSQYGPGVMERTILNQQNYGTLPKKLPATDGFVALPDCEDVGRVVFMRPQDKTQWESFLVADCASKTDRQSPADPRSGYEWMITEGIVAEVDYQTAKRWNTAGQGGFKVEITEPIPIVLFRQPQLLKLE